MRPNFDAVYAVRRESGLVACTDAMLTMLPPRPEASMAPISASSSAVAAPMPDPAPVTRQDRPANGAVTEGSLQNWTNHMHRFERGQGSGSVGQLEPAVVGGSDPPARGKYRTRRVHRPR